MKTRLIIEMYRKANGKMLQSSSRVLENMEKALEILQRIDNEVSKEHHYFKYKLEEIRESK